MKKSLLLLSLLMAGIMQAQIVNIPDANFKAYLLNYGIDTNEDGEIQTDEAMSIQFLEIFQIPGDPYSSLEGLQAFTNLTTLHINCTVDTINLSGLSQLTDLAVNDTNLSDINLTGLTNLQGLILQFTLIESLDVSFLTNLESLALHPALELSSLTVGNNENLTYLSIISNNIMELDLSSCPNFSSFYGLLSTENHDVYVNLKNGNQNVGPNAAISTEAMGSPYKIFVCMDEGEIENFQNIGDNVVATTYCTFMPGGDYNVITGTLLFDDEGDGCDSNDSVISNIKVDINDGTQSGSAFSNVGLYNLYVQAGAFTIIPDLDNDLFTITPPFAEINFTEVDSLVTTQNFCLTPNGNHPDLDIVVVPFGARPGFDADYKIIYRNKGNQTLSGDILFAYQEDELDFISANPPQDTSALGTLTWNYIGLAPFEQRQIFVTLNVNGPMETPAVNIDDNLQFTATINPVTGDDTPLDNVFGLKETVIGSFDPNDITCLEGRSINPDKIGEYLHYNINFENTGTAPATFIVVKDVIDTTQFDMASLQMINASHPVQATFTGNKVEFRFDEINLAPQGKGNVVFKVKTLNTLQVNDDVTQQADIFFDYNWPIVTNEATTVFEVLSRGEFEKDNTVKIYPNPSNGLVNITAASEIRSVELYDMQGRLLQAGGNASLDISGRAAGMYFINVLTEAGMKVEKVVKK